MRIKALGLMRIVPARAIYKAVLFCILRSHGAGCKIGTAPKDAFHFGGKLVYYTITVAVVGGIIKMTVCVKKISH